MSDIKKLLDEKANALYQIADCQQKLAAEEEMLNSLLSQPQSTANESSMRACRLGINAWKLSIVAFQGDIDRCQAQIDAEKKSLNLDSLAESISKLSEEDKVRFTNVMHGYLSGTRPNNHP